MKKRRIWELDSLRGLCILGMVIVHFVYDLVTFTEIRFHIPNWFFIVQQYGHILFILISGICVTLGSKSVKRGVIVFAAGLIITAVTVTMDYVLHMGSVRIWFGILQLLGICMMVYPIFKKLPTWALSLIGFAIVGIGYWFTTFTVGADFLFPLGLRSGNVFTGADFFPIFPHLGTFLLGAALGKTLYRDKTTLLPKISEKTAVIRFLSFVGRHSLEIYLVHQPLLFAVVMLIPG